MPGHHWIARCDRSVFLPVVRFALATALVALTAYTPIATAMPAVPGIFPAPVTDGEFEEPVTPQQEHRKRVQAGVAVEALSHDLFGDQINGYTGSVSFSVTDISIPGNSDLSVAIARRVDINELRGRGAKQRSAHVFEDWDLDIPHLHGVFEASTGWRAGPTPGVRCNQPNAALAAPPAIGAIEADDYWSGNHLYVPGQGDDEINHLSATFPDRPTDGQTYRWITKGYWYFSCLTETANGVPGDAFLARDPDGNRYWFNQVVEKLYAPLFKDINNRIARRETIILPTRIEDRFGNWVQYTYHPDNPRNLIRIEANDGRYLDLIYSNHTLPSSHITTVTDGVRTWSYDYITAIEGATLIGVGRPDGSAWTINLGDFHADHADSGTNGCGADNGFVYGFEKYAEFTHPSGATGKFTFKGKQHGRHGVPKNCWVGLGETGDRFPPVFTTWTLIGKEVGGPGLQTPLLWVWTYPSLSWSYNFQCEPNCVQTKVISVLQPDGSQTKQEWGVHYGKNDGLLLAEERIRGAEVLRRTEYQYRIDPVNQAYPALVGTRTRLYPDVSSGVHKPAISSKIEQQGVEMESAVPSTGDVYAFDRFARATQAQRASTLGFNKNELVEYHHDLDTWVLGQIKKVTNSVTGKVEREIDYDPVTALPTTLKSFGRLASTLSHYPGGQLHTITDAAVKTTTFSNYKRGIPRDVEFDDNQSIAGVVNDAGFLTDYTDELGHTTHYDFDPLGRLTGITHPAGDSVAWTPTTITFTKQLDDAYGIPEGHYKQSISTGNARKEVYFDALWRPILTREWDQSNPGGTQRFTHQRYDSDGRITFQAYPLDSVTTVDVISEGIESDYDPLGRLTETRASSELGTLTTTVEYLNNFQKRITNPRGKVTTIDFQVIDEATEELPVKIVALEGVTIDIVRDVYGKPKSITRSGTSPAVSATRRFVYDANERLCKTIEPERGAEVIAYDTASRIDWTAPGTNLTTNFTDCQQGNVAPGDKIVRSYDLRDRLIGINYPDTTLDEARTYYDDGALKSVTRGGGPEEVTWSYTYNKRRMLEREQLKIDAALPQNTYTEWTYNALGHVSRLKYVDGFTLDYLPNALGQPTRVRGVGDGIDYASGISYHPNGALTGFTYGNQVVHTSTPNMRDLPGTISDIGTNTLLSYTHTYDENGNPTVITDGVPGSPDSKTLTYDDLDRLEGVEAAGTFVSASMIYDGLDNLTKYQVGPRDYRYVINPVTQRLDRINNAVGTQLISYQHDVRGNTTQKNQTGNNLAFSFDRANRLTEVKRNNTVVSAYRYDGNGRRIKTVMPNGDFRYQIYSQAGQYLWDANFDEDQASHQVIQTAYDYIHLGDRLIAKRKSQNSSTLPESQLPLFADGFETLLRDPEAPQSSNVEAKDLVANPFEPSATAAISVQYVHVDALGSPVAESDNVGILIGSRTYYEPYGQPLTTPPEGSPSYTGHQFDVSTGLIQAQQRFLDPGTGRFLSTDPADIDSKTAGNFNRYWYADGNPYSNRDFDGGQAIPARRANVAVVPLPNAIRNAFVTAQVQHTVSQIQRYQPGFRYEVVRATRSTTPLYSQADVAHLQNILAQQVASHMCLAPRNASTPATAPNFLISRGGTAFPVPAGATGPTPVINPAGIQTGVAFTNGAGGANGQVTTMRIMNPTPAKGTSPGYPNGYVKYENASRQGVDPGTGKTLPNTQSHFEIK